MVSYLCGINTRSESSLDLSDLLFARNKGVPESDRNMFIRLKVNMT